MEVDPYDDPVLYTIDKQPPMKKFKKICRLIDLYALPITLRYKEEKKFYTNYGACSSIILIICMLSFFTSYLTKMLADTEITENVVTKLIKNKENKFDPKNIFIFGFKIYDDDVASFTDETVISWSISTTEREWDGSEYINRTTIYNLEKCDQYYQDSLSDVLILDTDDVSRAHLDEFLCPKDLKSPFIQGTEYEDVYKYTQLNVSVCQDTSVITCKDSATIRETVQKLKLNFFFLNTNFDGTNIDVPLVNYLDFSFHDGLEFEKRKITTIQLNSNVGVLNDDYLGTSATKEDDFLDFF